MSNLGFPGVSFDNTGSVRPVEQELKDHSSDGGCFLLYRSLLCPTELLKHYVSVVDRALQASSYYFQLVPRGSLARGTVLRYDIDIDLDIILPRSLYSEYNADNEPIDVTADDLLVWNRQVFEDVFRDVIDTPDGVEGHGVEGVKLLLKGDPNKLTRAIKGNLFVPGSPSSVKVDLFPKYISKDGRIMSLSRPNADKTREVLYADPLERQNLEEFDDEELAAIVFLKLWNKQAPVKSNIKSFHINVAVDSSRSRVSRAKDANPTKIKFKFNNVIEIMTAAIDELFAFYSAGEVAGTIVNNVKEPDIARLEVFRVFLRTCFIFE